MVTDRLGVGVGSRLVAARLADAAQWVRGKQAFPALVTAVILLAGCGAPSPTSPPPGGPVPEIKDFRIVAYQGEAVLGGRESSFSQVFDHGKPVVLNFWAGLCPPCRAEMPWFQKVADEFQGQVIFLGVDIGVFLGLGDQEDARRLLKELRVRYPAAYAVEAAPIRLYNIRSMPTTVLFNATGHPVEKHDGLMLEAQLREKVQKLVAASAS